METAASTSSKLISINVDDNVFVCPFTLALNILMGHHCVWKERKNMKIFKALHLFFCCLQCGSWIHVTKLYHRMMSIAIMISWFKLIISLVHICRIFLHASLAFLAIGITYPANVLDYNTKTTAFLNPLEMIYLCIGDNLCDEIYGLLAWPKLWQYIKYILHIYASKIKAGSSEATFISKSNVFIQDAHFSFVLVLEMDHLKFKFTSKINSHLKRFHQNFY